MVMVDLISILTVFLNSVVLFLPNLIYAIILLIIGWLIGMAIGRITKEVLVRLRIDNYIAKGKKPTIRLSEIFSLIFSWSIYLLFIWSAVGVLGIEALTTAMEAVVLNFLPGLIKAVIVIVAGYGIAEYVKKHLEESRMAFSGLMGRIMFFFTLYIAVAIALPLVGIDASLVSSIMLVLVATGGAIAVIIVWAMKDTLADMGKKYMKGYK